MKSLPIIGYSLLAVAAAIAGFYAYKKMKKPEIDTGSGNSPEAQDSSTKPDQKQMLPKVELKPYVPPPGQKVPQVVVANKSNIAPDTPSVSFTGDSDYFQSYFGDYNTRMIKFQSDI